MVPVVPIPNRNRLSDLYGTSEITPELRSVTDAAARTLMLMQSTAELMGVPLRLLFGIKRSEIGLPDDPDEPVSPRQAFEAYYARILGFEDEMGKAYQFDAAELRNFVDALDALDKKAAAYTGLPPQYLSFSSDNPASAEAIRSSESRLVMNCERKARIFGGAWEQVMRVAYRVMNPVPRFHRTCIGWKHSGLTRAPRRMPPRLTQPRSCTAKAWASSRGSRPGSTWATPWRHDGRCGSGTRRRTRWANSPASTPRPTRPVGPRPRMSLPPRRFLRSER